MIIKTCLQYFNKRSFFWHTVFVANGRSRHLRSLGCVCVRARVRSLACGVVVTYICLYAYMLPFFISPLVEVDQFL